MLRPRQKEMLAGQQNANVDDCSIPRFNPLSPAVLPNPYPYYHHLRTHDPVHWGLAEDSDAPGRWYITRLQDVVALLKDERFGREVDRVLPPPTPKADTLLEEVAEGWMILRDPPTHTHLRGLVH